MRWTTLRPPKDVTSRLSLAQHERVLAAARSATGEWYVGTDLALHLPDDSDGGYRRVPWEDVERAEWHSDSDRLAIVEVAGWGQPERVSTIQVDEPGRLLELLRERVTKSVVYSTYAPVRRRSGLRVVGRRSPSGSGPIGWSYLLSPELDPHDPEVEQVAAEALARARRELEEL